MRPFRFFFALALGIIVFLFLARFILIAFFMAAVFSILYYAARRMYAFLSRLGWDGEDDGRYDWAYGKNQIGSENPMWYHQQPDYGKVYERDYRTIIIE